VSRCAFGRFHGCKSSFEAEVMPPDLLVSGARKEMLGRILTVRDVWSVKTLRYQRKKTRKRQW